MDFGTIAGLVGGLIAIFYGISSTPGGEIRQFLDTPSLLITVGGSTCALFVSYPTRDILEAFRACRNAFRVRTYSPLKLIEDFRRFADIARRDGILALENVTREIQDPFLTRGIQLAVDGTDPEVISALLSTELDQIADRHDRGIKVLKSIGALAPAFGMIGTLIGLVIMLVKLDDPKAIGPAMGVAIITTFYGAMIAYLFAMPMADKLGRRDAEELHYKEMIVRGIMSIQSGDNPRIVEQKLKVFLSPRLRGQSTP